MLDKEKIYKTEWSKASWKHKWKLSESSRKKSGAKEIPSSSCKLQENANDLHNPFYFKAYTELYFQAISLS